MKINVIHHSSQTIDHNILDHLVNNNKVMMNNINLMVTCATNVYHNINASKEDNLVNNNLIMSQYKDNYHVMAIKIHHMINAEIHTFILFFMD